MKILLVIIFVLFLLYVGGMMYVLCYVAGEADEMEREYLEKHSEYKFDEDIKPGSQSGCGEAAINTGSERDH